jgi:hypothetical protein
MRKKLEPLAILATTAPSPIMRELAQIAVARSFRQESLAKALAERTGLRVQGANVGRYFRSRTPHADTITAFASVLGVSPEHIRLARGEVLSPEESAHELGARIGPDIRSLLYPHVRDRTDLDALLVCDNDARVQRAVSAYALEREREQHGIKRMQQNGRVYLPGRVVAFLEVLHPDLSLDDLVQRSPIVGALSSLFFAALGYFSESECDAIVGVARALLVARGVDCAPLDRDLQDQKAHAEAVFHERGFTLHGDNV